MYLLGLDAAMGTGKTLGMSLLAQHFRQQSGCTLWSNYGLSNARLFTNFEQFLEVAQQPSSIICLDEVHTDLDSRSGNTNTSKYLTHMLYYLRKIRATIFYATPDISSVDVRVRSVTNVYCRVSKNKRKFKYEMWDLQSVRYLRTLMIDKEKVFAIADQIYDTHKMVVPMEFPEKKEEYIQLINMLKNISDQYYVRQVQDAPRLQVSEA
ncbi:AAA family ATPase [Paenibacillus sp. NPDC058367]|uniref:AAA family ATPase n=1 Tax=Paenibacillus sp. NPDC058367 TaxID=3346460 RepID=UPI00366626C3